MTRWTRKKEFLCDKLGDCVLKRSYALPVMDVVVPQVAMRALGFEVKKVDVLKILKDYDREGNGKITYEDFSEVGKLNQCAGWCQLLWGDSIFTCSHPLLSFHSDRPHTGARPEGGDHEGI